MPEETWWLPGFEIERLLGFGGSGEVWRARDTTTGETVALKRLRRVAVVPDGGSAGAAAAEGERLRREAALLADVAGPHVLRLRGVVVTDTETVLVLDHAAGGSLGALLAVRGVLDPAEVVTVLAPLAATLGDLHARGLVHGDVSPSNVLFTADGRPLLADLGLARLLGEGAAPGPVEGTAAYVDPLVARGGVPTAASDVHSLAAIGYAALAGHPPWDAPTPSGAIALAAAGKRLPLADAAPAAPGALVTAIEAALAPDPSARPTPSAFAAAVRAALAPAPVRLVRATAPEAAPPTDRVVPARPADPPEPPARRHRGRLAARRTPRLPRSAVTAVLATVALLAAAAAGVAWGRAEPAAGARVVDVAQRPPAPRGSVPGAAGTDWRAVVADLVAARAGALTRRDERGLLAAYAPGAAARASDAATVRALRRSDEHLSAPLRQPVTAVTVVSETTARVRLRVADTLAPYDVVDATGTVVRHDPGRATSWWQVDLVRAGAGTGGWRIAAIVPA